MISLADFGRSAKPGRRLAGLAFVSFCSALPASAQSSPSREALAWLAYFGRVDLTTRWAAVGEFHERRWRDPLRVHQRLVRTHLQRQFGGGLTLGVGYTYFQQGIQNPERPALPLVNEHRPHIQADLSQKLSSRITLNHRLRSEWRAIPMTTEGRALDGEYTHAGRVRYRFGVDTRITSRFGSPLLRISDEYHVMFADRPFSFDQNRLQAGFDWRLSPSVTLETAYLWWHQRLRNGVLVNRDYLRLSINHRMVRR
jgi:hypothetical protein